jgi:histidine triad (HIT) family protein
VRIASLMPTSFTTFLQKVLTNERLDARMPLEGGMGCIFCSIVRGEAPAIIVYQDDLITAFRDIHPRAPVHILLVPNQHIPSAADLRPDHEAIIARLVLVATDLARRERIEARGYRLVANVGREGGQSVSHLHVHLLGGRPLGVPWG